MRVYRSASHPGTASWAFTYARMLVPPLAGCLLPVMVVTLVLVLEAERVLPFVTVAGPAAVALAVLWTVFRLKRELAEIHVGEAAATVRTVWDVAQRRPLPRARAVLDVRDYTRWMLVTIGLSSYELERSDWPDYDALRDALRDARRHHRLFS